MQEIKDTSLFTEITAVESASVNGAHRNYRHASRRRGCNNYSYNPYFDGRPVHGYVHNTSHRRYYYN